MTALHWLAFNNDEVAIKVLLENAADTLALNSDGQLAIDIAGTIPSYGALDTLLHHYSEEKKLHPPQAYHTNKKMIRDVLKKADGPMKINFSSNDDKDEENKSSILPPIDDKRNLKQLFIKTVDKAEKISFVGKQLKKKKHNSRSKVEANSETTIVNSQFASIPYDSSNMSILN